MKPTVEGSPLLKVQDLSAHYGGVQALRGVSLAVAEGGIVAVLGNNGAGKSTLLRAIAGTIELEGGEATGSVQFRDRELCGMAPAEIARAGVVHVPEGRRVFARLTVDENLRAGSIAGRARGRREAAQQRVHELFPVLAERSAQRAGLLSGGEQQMLAIGRALMSHPELLLLDEPSLGLAPQVVDQIADVVREINQQGTAIVLVEQNATMALECASQAVVLEVGEVTLAGDAPELADSEEVRNRYLGIASGQPKPTRSRGDAAPARPTEPSRQPELLAAEGVTVRFGGIQALQTVSFEVQPGSIHALIGPNGAGKSTMLNVLTGVYRASAGEIRYGDHRLAGRRPHEIAALGISRTFQNTTVSERSTVVDNLMLGRHRLGRAGFVATGLGLRWARRERDANLSQVRESAALVGLGDRLDQRADTLPYGDRKRLELGRALCAEPALLLLDEPVAGMNAAESERMAQTIIELRAALGVSIVVIEHDMAFVMGMADRVTVLDFGRCIANGPSHQVQRDPAVIRAYLGGRQAATDGDA